MIFLTISFLLAVLFLLFVFFKNKNSASTSLPYFVSKATPSPVPVTPTPDQTDPLVQKGKELIGGFEAIDSDVGKVFKDDTRLIPPQFFFEKEVSQ